MSQSGVLNDTIFPPGLLVETLTGNTGGAVHANSSNNIFVVGDGVTCTVVGSPSLHSLTISVLTPAVEVIPYTGVTHAQSPYTTLSTDYYISCDLTGGVITIRLPNAPATGRVYIIKDRLGLAATSNITITTPGGTVTLDGSTSFVMNTAYEAIQFVFNGTNYEGF
jgi:hypothetical protein